MAEDWDQRLEAAPITLPDGRVLETLDDARLYLTAQRVPKSEVFRDMLATAIRITMAAAEGRDFTMTARKAVRMYAYRNEPDEQPQPPRQARKGLQDHPVKVEAGDPLPRPVPPCKTTVMTGARSPDGDPWDRIEHTAFRAQTGGLKKNENLDLHRYQQARRRR